LVDLFKTSRSDSKMCQKWDILALLIHQEEKSASGGLQLLKGISKIRRRLQKLSRMDG